MTILVADDNPAVLRLVSRVLRQGGFKVLTAGTGQELLNVWVRARGKCEIVLSDVQMPGALDGIQACGRIRREDPRARVFLMTGDPGHCARAAASGLKIVLQKPFDLEALRAWSRKLRGGDG